MDDLSMDDLVRRLERAGLPLDSWGRNGAKSIDDLRQEIEYGEARLLGDGASLLRAMSITRLIVRRGDAVLIEARQLFRDGRERRRGTLPGEKMKPGESAEEAALRCAVEELGIEPESVEILRVREPWENVEESPSYPGLRSRYVIWDVETSITDLPEGDFETSEGAADDAVARHFWEWRDGAKYP